MEGQNNIDKSKGRSRIELLLDPGSFQEIGALTNNTTVRTGYGTMEGKLVYVYSEDSSLSHGIFTKENGKKICNIMGMALKMGAPLIKIHDSIGADIKEGIEILASYGDIIKLTSALMGAVPQISIIPGYCTGISAINAAMSDITIMVKEKGEFYVNPPKRISEEKGEYIIKDSYGNSEESKDNGSIQKVVNSEAEAFSIARKLVQLLPSNNIELTEVLDENEIEDSDIESLSIIAAEGKINSKEILSFILDKGSYVELDEYWGNNVVTALGTIYGIVTGILIVNPEEERGLLSIKDVNKIAKFIKLCNGFNISIVNLVNAKGFMADVQEEKEGLAYSIGRMSYYLCEAVVPKITLILGEAYGGVYSLLCSKSSASDLLYAWPEALVSPLEPEKMVDILYREEIKNFEYPKQKHKDLLSLYLKEQASANYAGGKGEVDDIIIPSKTKARIFTALDMLQSKREVKYPKKHGSSLV